MCRRTEEEAGPTVGLPSHRHFVGFFNVPVQAPTGDHTFYTVIPTPLPPISCLLRSRLGYGGHILDLTPPPRGGGLSVTKVCQNYHISSVHLKKGRYLEQYAGNSHASFVNEAIHVLNIYPITAWVLSFFQQPSVVLLTLSIPEICWLL